MVLRTGRRPSGGLPERAGRNPLLFWPQPETDRPDAFFRRQFSDSGQCFHYMGPLTDGLTGPLPGTSVPRGLATSSVVRCNDLLDDLLRQVVVDGGPGARRSGFGLYEMMHIVEDSFSGAHTQRAPGGVDYLRVWKPMEKIAGLSTERERQVPDEVFHKGDDRRDKTYVVEGGAEACETRVDHPYDVPYSCLSEEGDLARQAVVELLVAVRDLRAAQLAAPPGTDTHPETSPAWRQYRARWLAAVHPCEGAECDVRAPPEAAPGRYAYLGVDMRLSTPGTYDVGARGTVLRYAEDLNPFVYAMSASLGTSTSERAGTTASWALAWGSSSPWGRKAFIGLTPAELRIVYGASGGNLEMLTRLLRLDYAVSQDVALSVEGPLVVNWVQPAVHWSLGVGVSYGLSSPHFVGGHSLVRHDETAERRDDSGCRLRSVRTARGTAGHLPRVRGRHRDDDSRPRRRGADVRLRDARRRDGLGPRSLGGPLRLHPVVSLAAGLRNTSGESSYVTGTLGLGVRWYFLGPLGLSVTALRVRRTEGPRKERGGRQHRRPRPPGRRVLPPRRLAHRARAPTRPREYPGRESDDRLDLGPLRNERDPRVPHGDRAVGVGPSSLHFASSIFRAASAPASFTSAFSPAVISLTSTTTFRMVPVNLVLAGW